MTEALKQFIIKNSSDFAPFDPYQVRVHFWLAAFVREVERRANELGPEHLHVVRELARKGEALEKIVRDFGLDKQEATDETR